MASWCKATRAQDGRETTINLERVLQIEPNGAEGATVHYLGGDELRVRESRDELVAEAQRSVYSMLRLEMVDEGAGELLINPSEFAELRKRPYGEGTRIKTTDGDVFAVKLELDELEEELLRLST